jgi:hypothetical protein
LNARDLSEPPNGTTSGCPPPSRDHNYRGLLHTQQRNHFQRPDSAPFPMGVAQITRVCDRHFLVRHCFCFRFLDSAISRRSRLWAPQQAPRTRRSARSHRIEGELAESPAGRLRPYIESMDEAHDVRASRDGRLTAEERPTRTKSRRKMMGSPIFPGSNTS